MEAASGGLPPAPGPGGTLGSLQALLAQEADAAGAAARVPIPDTPLDAAPPSSVPVPDTPVQPALAEADAPQAAAAAGPAVVEEALLAEAREEAAEDERRRRAAAEESRKKAADELKAALEKARAKPVPPRPEVEALRALCGCVRALARSGGPTAVLFAELSQQLPRLGEAFLGPFMGVKRRGALTGALDAKAGGLAHPTRLKGRVKSYNTKKGFGFLDLREFPRDVFVYNSQLIGRIGLIAGETVEFDLIFDEGRPQAQRVKVVSGPAINDGVPFPTMSGKDGAQQSLEPTPLPTAENPFSALKQAMLPQQTPLPNMRDLALALAAQAAEVPSSLPPAPAQQKAASERPGLSVAARIAAAQAQAPKSPEEVMSDKIREAQRVAAADKAGPAKPPISAEEAAQAVWMAQARAQQQKQDSIMPGRFGSAWPMEELPVDAGGGAQPEAAFTDEGPIPRGATVQVCNFPVQDVNLSFAEVQGYDAATGRYSVTVEKRKTDRNIPEKVKMLFREEYLQVVSMPEGFRGHQPRGNVGSVAAASAAAAQAASQMPQQPMPLRPGASQALVKSAADALKRFSGLVPQPQQQQPPPQPPQPSPFSQPGPSPPGAAQPWASASPYAQPSMSKGNHADQAAYAAIQMAKMQQACKGGKMGFPAGVDAFGKGKGQMSPIPGEPPMPGQHPAQGLGAPGGMDAQSPPRPPMQAVPPPQPQPRPPDGGRVVSLAQELPGGPGPMGPRPGMPPMMPGQQPHMPPGSQAQPPMPKGAPKQPGPGPQQPMPQQQQPGKAIADQADLAKKVAQAPAEGFVGQTWQVTNSKEFTDVIVREGQEVQSREIRRIRPGEICMQRGPTVALNTGLMRMPVQPDGWVTVHARLIGGPTFMVEQRQPQQQQQQPYQQQQQPPQQVRQPPQAADRSAAAALQQQQQQRAAPRPPPGHQEIASRAAPPNGQQPPPDRQAAASGHGAAPASQAVPRYQQQGKADGDWGGWKSQQQGKEQENWWDQKGDQKPMWTQEEWDQWSKNNPAKAKEWDNKWKGWDDWDNKAKAKDDWDSRAKGEEQTPAPAKAPSDPRPTAKGQGKDQWAAASASASKEGQTAASAQGGFDPWSKALDRNKDQPAAPAAKAQPGPWKDNEDPWSKAVDPWSKAVGASAASKPLLPSKPKEPPKETPQPSWGSMTRTAGPSYQRLDLLSSRASGALGGEEDCSAWSGIGQLKGIRAMRVPTLEFGAGGQRRRDRRERGRDDGDGHDGRGSSPGPARDEAGQPRGDAADPPSPRDDAEAAEPDAPPLAPRAAPAPDAAPAAPPKPPAEDKKAAQGQNCPTQ